MKTEIKKLPAEYEKDAECLIKAAKEKHNFNVATAILRSASNNYYQYTPSNESLKNLKSCQKPTKPGKQKANECFTNCRVACLQKLGMDLVLIRLYNKTQGEFINLSFEHCPVDVLDYVLATRH